MLDIYWAIACTTVSLVGAYLLHKSTQTTSDANKDFEFMGMVFGGGVMAITFLWERLDATYFKWLSEVIPSSQSDIHLLTVWFFIGVSCLIWIFLPVILPMLFMYDDCKISIRNFRLFSKKRSEKPKLTVVE
ncbi:MAG: hypothetical protein ACI936_003552 [Paraglaciecola sp.]|jgi:hypothetical protein